MPPLFCSTVIPTVGRDTLTRAVTSVLAQELDTDDFEIIVVNDSGRPLPDAEWRRSSRVRVIETQRRERSVARNTGAAIARGRFLHFLDDDDWLVPGALRRLASVARSAGAAWVYGHSHLVDRAGRPLIALRQAFTGNCFVQAIAGEWIPLQASLVSADAFFATGGFDPLLAGPEDIDLLRRITLEASVACTPALIACISWGAEGSTTEYGGHSAQSRAAREKILDRPGVPERLRGSACSSYWHGRILRAYATSAVWNLERRRLLAATSRSMSAVISLALAGTHLLAPAFWRAALRQHASEAFAEGLREAAAEAAA